MSTEIRHSVKKDTEGDPQHYIFIQIIPIIIAGNEGRNSKDAPKVY